MAVTKTISTGSANITLATGLEFKTTKCVLQIGSGSGVAWVGTLTPFVRMGSDAPLQPVVHTPQRTGTSVATPISTTGVYHIDVSAGELILTHAHTTGSVEVYWTPLQS